MPLVLEDSDDSDDEAGELEAGQHVYEVLGDVVRELEPETLMSLVGAIQRGETWPRLPESTRAILADLDARLFDVEEDD